MAKKKWFVRALMILPGFLILGFLLTRIPMGQVIEKWRDINIYFLLLGIFLFVPMILLKTLRWKVILDNLGIKEVYSKLLQLSLLGFFMGVATPGQAGDFIKLWHMKKKGHSMKDSLLSLIADRTIDLFIFLAMGTFGIFYFLNVLTSKHQVLFLASFALLFLLCGVFWRVMIKRQHFFAHPAVERVLGKVLKEDKLRALQEIENVNTDASFWIRLSAVSIFEKLVLFFRLYALALSLGITVNFLIFVYVMAIVTLIQLVPITVEGIGTRDVALVYFLGHLGYSSAAALSLSFVILFARILNTLPGFIVWLHRPAGDVLIENN